MKRISRFVTYKLSIAICVLAVHAFAHGQEADPAPLVEPAPTPTITVADIEQQQKTADETGLDDEAKKQLAELYRQALDQAKKTQTQTKQLAVFRSAKETAAKRAEGLKEKLKTPNDATPPVVSPSETLPELEQRLTRVDQQVKDLKAQLAKADGEVAARSARRKVIRDRLVEAKKQLDEAEKQVEAPPNGTSPVVADAKKTELRTQIQSLQTELPMLQAELEMLDAEDAVDLPRLNRESTAQQLVVAEAELQVVQTAVNKLGSKEARKLLSSAVKAVDAQTDPALRKIAQRTVELAEQYLALTKSIVDAKAKLTEAHELKDHWVGEATSAKEKVKSIGLTDTIGGMLRKQKLSLPNPNLFLTNIDARTATMNAAQLELLERDEESKSDIDETLQELQIDDVLPDAIRAEAQVLITNRNELLSPLVRAQSSYFDTLVELSNTEQQIANQIRDYGKFIDERVLWVRSGQPLWASFEFDRSDLWLLNSSRWNAAKNSLLADMKTGFVWYGLAILLLVVLLRNRLLFRKRIRECGTLAESGSCIQFAPTMEALLATVVAALPWPALLGFLSWRLSIISGSNEVLRTLSHGTFSVAFGYYPLDFFRLVSKPKGLAEAHFGWSTDSVQPVRRCIRAAMLVCLPLVLVTATLSASTSGMGQDTFERLTFVAVTVSLSFLLSRVLHSKSGAFSRYLAKHATGWVSRLQPLWYWGIVLSPLVLTGLTSFGYYYTAQQLAWRLFATACLLGAVVVASAFASRLLLVQRRKLSIEQARQRRAAQLKASQDETAAIIVEELPTAEDLRGQIAQSQNLLRTAMAGVALVGIWIAWVDVLPALSFLEQWPLWDSTTQVTQIVEAEDGEVTFKTREVLDPVTIAEVVLAVLVVGLTFVAARNVPGVLEISILQRLPIEASVRYAISTIVSYLIVVLGIVIACRTIGIHWNQVQWMATALTFGLAFGLQEMFANFVAGIIILFERPIRVGDIVTVDDISGTVSRVQIRATTITNWDRKDYIVPNKDFITGRVLNWTLSDQVNRIVINVGIAYGSDTQCLDTLNRVVSSHPMVVAEPEPIVTFEEFGGSSLNFVVRCFIALKDMPARLRVVNQLHQDIDAAFRKEKIEIAFPQQDLHIRSVTPDFPGMSPQSNGHAKKVPVKKIIGDDLSD